MGEFKMSEIEGRQALAELIKKIPEDKLENAVGGLSPRQFAIIFGAAGILAGTALVGKVAYDRFSQPKPSSGTVVSSSVIGNENLRGKVVASESNVGKLVLAIDTRRKTMPARNVNVEPVGLPRATGDQVEGEEVPEAPEVEENVEIAKKKMSQKECYQWMKDNKVNKTNGGHWTKAKLQQYIEDGGDIEYMPSGARATGKRLLPNLYR